MPVPTPNKKVLTVPHLVSRSMAMVIAQHQYDEMHRLQLEGNPFCRLLLTREDWCINRAFEIHEKGATDTELSIITNLNK